MEFLKKRNVDKESNADPWIWSEEMPDMNTWQDYISLEIEVSKELAANFNFPKIDIMWHWVKQIH
jgi:hypothetical protein